MVELLDKVRPTVEGLYNAAFSGMQAYSRAELGGATKEKAREAMAQHAVAEGIKPGGIIDQRLQSLQTSQETQMKALQGGAEKAKVTAAEKLKEETAGKIISS